MCYWKTRDYLESDIIGGTMYRDDISPEEQVKRIEEILGKDFDGDGYDPDEDEAYAQEDHTENTPDVYEELMGIKPSKKL